MKRWRRIGIILNIFSYLIAGIGFFSTVMLVGIPFRIAFIILALMAIVRDLRTRFPNPGRILSILAVISVAIGLSRLSGQEIVLPGLETLLLLMGLKCLDKHGPRDYLQLYVLSILLVAGSSLLSLDLTFFFYLGALIFLLGPATVLLTYERVKPGLALSRQELRAIIGYALFIPVLVMPLALTIFVILPRTSYPIFGFLNRPASASSGFSDQVRLGNVTQIQLDDSLVFRSDMERQNDRFLYWRGMVFDEFNGVSWQNSGAAREVRSGTKLQGKSVFYTIYLEPSEYQILFTLEKPVYISYRQSRRFDDQTFKARDQLQRKISYQAVSVLTNREPGDQEEMDRYLELPPGLERLRNLTGELVTGRRREEIPAVIQSHLLRPPFRYSLKKLPQSKTPLDDFLFRTHTGNCEYFATSMALMLRICGIPSRLVGGYRGGYYHDLGHYYAVQQRDAHVWIEAYLPPQGWTRFDPTPAVPVESERVMWRQIFFRLRMTMDILDYYWNRHVISYDLQRQYALLMAVTQGLAKPDLEKVAWKDLGRRIVPAIGVLITIILSFMLMREQRRQVREKRLLEKFLELMETKGWRRRECMGLEEFVEGIADLSLREQGREFIRVFQENYYRDRPAGKEDLRRLSRILKSLAKRSPRQQ